MNRIIAILLIFLMFFSSFEKLSILVYYQTYQEYIAEYLCENKDKPAMHCNGQCFLMKKLQKAEKQKSTPVVPDNQKSDFLVVDFAKWEIALPKIDPVIIPTVKHLVETQSYSDIFRPPKS